jgi:D-glycero-D-manno-heptose 1,7-bisphosphate phosphatase
MKKTPAIFIDRDGTINQEVGYIGQVKDLRLIPGSAEAIRLVNQSGRKVVVISNQSGVARGYFDEQVVETINTALIKMLEAEQARVDGIYYCPHHLKGYPPYNIDCSCRKPASGMLLQAAEDLNLDLTQSAVIGDKYTDVLTGHRLGIPGLLVRTGFGEGEIEKHSATWNKAPDFIAADLLEAVRWVLSESKLKKTNS